jgi:esterase/lipase superfamily enzyme
MPATVFFASNRILTGDPAVVTSYGPNIQAPSVSTDIIYATAFVDGVNIKADQSGSITSIQDPNKGAFAANVASDLSNAGRNLLVFIHGFDNTFEDAITRAAFNREFLAASGKPGTDTTVLAFSWPSLGKIFSFPVPDADYRHDQKMASLSGIHLMSFFAQIEPLLRTARANGRRSYLLAHSMGNLALENALHGNGNAEMFNVSILAAGDCGFDAFAQPNLTGLDGLSLLTSRISIYYSDADEVLGLSRARCYRGRYGAGKRLRAGGFSCFVYHALSRQSRSTVRPKALGLPRVVLGVDPAKDVMGPYFRGRGRSERPQGRWGRTISTGEQLL